LANVDAAVKASCDAVDGVMDGLIQNPAACSFNLSSLVPSVLTATQAGALQSWITRVTDHLARGLSGHVDQRSEHCWLYNRQ
jgi:feruloyl esterase